MILTAYLDESGTHAGTRFLTVGGFIGQARDWREFDRRWKKMCVKAGRDYIHGKEVFKATRNRAAYEREVALIDRMTALTERYAMAGFSCTINRADYQECYREPLRGVRKARCESEYALCVKVLAYEIAALVGRSFPDKRPRIHFILEEGHVNAGDAVRAFHELKQKAPEDLVEALGTISFGEKKRFPGLQAADSMAHVAFKSDEKGIDLVEHEVTFSDDFTLKALRNTGSHLLKYGIDAKALTGWRDDALAEAERRRAWGARRQRADVGGTPA